MKTTKQNRRENLEILVAEVGTLDAVADKADLPNTVYLSQIRNMTPIASTGNPRNMGDKIAAALEKAFGKPVGWMDKDHSTTTSNVSDGPVIKGQIPLISWVQAGEWCDVEVPYQLADIDTWYACTDKHGARTYALRVEGSSMCNPSAPVSFSDGDVIFVDPDREAIQGSLVIVCTSGKNTATFKKLVIEGGKRYLQPLNPDWPEKIIELDDEAHICGVVICKYQSLV